MINETWSIDVFSFFAQELTLSSSQTRFDLPTLIDQLCLVHFELLGKLVGSSVIRVDTISPLWQIF